MSGNGKRSLVADRRYPSGTPRKAAGGDTGGRGRASGGNGGGPRKPRRQPAPRRRRGPLGMIVAAILLPFRLAWKLAWRAGVVVAIFIALGIAYYASTMPPIEERVDGRARGSVTLMDRNGQTFAWRGEQFGGMVTASTVSPHLRNAIIATEDRRFYWHPGVDPVGTAAAMYRNVNEGRGPLEGQGGSSITQQTAKLLCRGQSSTPRYGRPSAPTRTTAGAPPCGARCRRRVYALAMEARYSKEEILTIYMNRAYLGAGSRGFEAAAQRYFGKSAAEVTPAEAAMLAGLLRAPSTYAPTSNLQRRQDRAAVVIGLMEEQGYLSASAADEARANPAHLSSQAQQDSGGFFADWVMDTGPEFFTRDTTEDVTIRTTLDPRIQAAAEEALIHVFDTQVREGSDAQAAIVVMSADGAVRAMVGGRNIDATGAFNRATQALRQTGSSFKPFVYAAALDMGMTPLDTVEDTPLTIDIPGSGPWTPDNYDHQFHGTITLLEALEESRNIPAVRLARQVGLQNVVTVAEMFGIAHDLRAVPSMALGANESTLLEMTGAYAGILNGGSSVTPYGLVELRLQGDDEPIMGQGGGIGERVIQQHAARELVWMMHNVVENGTGQRARVEGHQIAGKTGTTSAARDAWFIGFSGEYVAGVWMGYDNNTPLSGVTGAGLPAEIWRETMTRVLAGQVPVPLPMDQPTAPSGVVAGATDPALDAALREAFGEPVTASERPPGSETEDALMNVLSNILSGN